jgi:hypothetical protein
VCKVAISGKRAFLGAFIDLQAKKAELYNLGPHEYCPILGAFKVRLTMTVTHRPMLRPGSRPISVRVEDLAQIDEPVIETCRARSYHYGLPLLPTLLANFFYETAMPPACQLDQLY